MTFGIQSQKLLSKNQKYFSQESEEIPLWNLEIFLSEI